MAGISTPYDELPIEVRRETWGWFGEPWWSHICYGEDGQLLTGMHKAFPVGESCLHCGELFDQAAGDSGQAMPCMTTSGTVIRHAHKECSLRSVMGSIAHLEGRCHCRGGDSNDTPGLSLRQDALEVWEWVRVHGVAAAAGA